jgi:predicted RNase H-like nuclease
MRNPTRRRTASTARLAVEASAARAGRSWHRRGLIAPDDVIDGLAAAVLARQGELKTIPEYPEEDGVGLRMEMVYAEEKR